VTAAPPRPRRRGLARQRRQIGHHDGGLLARLRPGNRLDAALELLEVQSPDRGVALELLKQQLPV